MDPYKKVGIFLLVLSRKYVKNPVVHIYSLPQEFYFFITQRSTMAIMTFYEFNCIDQNHNNHHSSVVQPMSHCQDDKLHVHDFNSCTFPRSIVDTCIMQIVFGFLPSSQRIHKLGDCFEDVKKNRVKGTNFKYSQILNFAGHQLCTHAHKSSTFVKNF